MATRSTLAEIKKLEKKMKKDNPGLTFAVDHNVGESPVFPGAIEAQGLTVSRWDGETPYVKWEEWEITELVTCQKCGKDWKSRAIGEINGLCFECSKKLNSARDPRTDSQVRADTADEIARDLHREWWCQ